MSSSKPTAVHTDINSEVDTIIHGYLIALVRAARRGDITEETINRIQAEVEHIVDLIVEHGIGELRVPLSGDLPKLKIAGMVN